MPNGANLISGRGAPAGRSAVLTTDEQLQIAAAPERIDRLNRANNIGKIGPDVNTFPMTYGTEYVGSQPLVHVAQGVSLTPLAAGSIDDTVSVPAVFAGNPLP